MDTKILIVGAGPTGLTAAVELARHGCLAQVIDARSGPLQLSRAVGILQRSMDILTPSGVADDIRTEAIKIAGVAFHIGSARCAEFPLNFDDASCLLGLPQDRTEHFLKQAFERYGGMVDYGQTLLFGPSGTDLRLCRCGQLGAFSWAAVRRERGHGGATGSGAS